MEWTLTEGETSWTVRRNGVLQHTADAERTWQYVADHAADEDRVCVRYVSGRLGPTVSGDELRSWLRVGYGDTG